GVVARAGRGHQRRPREGGRAGRADRRDRRAHRLPAAARAPGGGRRGAARPGRRELMYADFYRTSALVVWPPLLPVLFLRVFITAVVYAYMRTRDQELVASLPLDDSAHAGMEARTQGGRHG